MHVPYSIIVDLEATCCDQGSIPRNQMEIIEIGAIAIKNSNLEPIDQFNNFVKPIRNPQLTPFCKQLTSITQQQVNTASTYPIANKQLIQWLKQFSNHEFCSWGDYDYHQFKKDCAFHKVQYPFSEGHTNIKLQFSKYLGTKECFGLKQALQKLKIKFEGTHHRGIDDAINIAKIYKIINESPSSKL